MDSCFPPAALSFFDDKKKKKKKKIELATKAFLHSQTIACFDDCIPSMQSAPTTHGAELNEEFSRVNVYDDNGYLPIHRATFNGLEGIVRTILDDAERRNDLKSQLEAVTHDEDELTPLLIAVTVGRLDILNCLLEYPVNLSAIDANGNGRSAASIPQICHHHHRLLLPI